MRFKSFERDVSSLHLEGAISSSGSKKGQVKMGAAAGFYVLFKVQVGPDCVSVFCSVGVVSAAFMLSFCFSAHVFSAQPASLMPSLASWLMFMFSGSPPRRNSQRRE